MEHTDLSQDALVELWPLVLVPDPPPWPRSFGWVAQAGPGSVLLTWWPGEPSDAHLPLLGDLSPRLEVELVRPSASQDVGGDLDVLVGERRLPGVLARGGSGWTATLLVPGDQLDDRGDLAVTVRATGVPAPDRLRLRVRSVGPLALGRERIVARVRRLS